MRESVGICKRVIYSAGVVTLAVYREYESAKSDMYTTGSERYVSSHQSGC